MNSGVSMNGHFPPTFKELCGKEVICTCDGARLGYVNDLEFDEKTGCVCALLLPDNKPFSFSRKPRFRVCLDWIEQFGKDLILICRYEELNACKKR